jgi:UDP-N-acetylmuramyl pentapeptide phosphotransferase/UDP-N-acetylglucosamine-1-phosphate transferase
VNIVVAFVVGAAAVTLLRFVAADMFAAPALARTNYRNRLVPTAGGVLLALAVLVVEAGRAFFEAFGVGDDPGLTASRNLVLLAVFGFGLLGLVDDIVARGNDRGFRGHLGAVFRGRITTGLVKLVGGAGVAVVLVADPESVSAGSGSGVRLVLDALLVALAANLGNLFDRAPGRVIKVSLVAYLPLALVVGTSGLGVAMAPVMGAAVGLLVPDLRERLMLGDTGANILGAVLGLGIVLGLGSTARTVVLAVVASLNVAAELVSFSDVIDRVPALRAVDRLGREV